MKANGTGQDRATSKAGAISQAVAMLSAMLASACCWLPPLLITSGISGGSLAAKFEASRPVLLPVTLALLSLAFYFTCRKPKVAAVAASSGEESCGCPPERSKWVTIRKLNRTMFWVVTVFVLAFAFFPNYAGFFLAGDDTVQARADTERVEWRMAIKGMTCRACAARIQTELAKVSGVSGAKVDYGQASAAVTAAPEVNETPLRMAVEVAGYSVSSIENVSRKQGGSR